MAYTTINKSSEHFNTVTYTGNGLGTRAVTGVGFQPDLVWIKGRSVAEHHNLYDAIRGATKPIFTNLTYAEATVANSLKSFGGDGFTISDNAYIGQNNATYASWNWKANGTGSANTVGSINSTVSVNTTSGFSIVSYTGTGSAATIGHGLGVSPACIIIKNTSDSGGVDWFVYHQSTGATNRTKLNQTVASATSSFINNTTPSPTVFNTEGGGASGVNANNYIAYCFAEKQGFSKFGSYVGNGSTNGTFIYTGFSPAFIMVKRTDSTSDWTIFDNKRPGYNLINKALYPNGEWAEGTGDALDFTSNGFKWRVNSSAYNGSGGDYIYMAFAEAPLVGTNNVPANAR
jgi:hypothetical protein